MPEPASSFFVAGFAQQSQNEVPDSEPKTAKNGLQIEPLSKGNLRTLDRFEGHNSNVVGMKKGGDYLTKYRMAAVRKMLMTASSKKTIQPSFITWS